jgi:predicted RNA binding protein YcfA (HicA-like mRNA interferase family)
VVRVPPLKPDQVISILISLGFMEVRQRGSHKQFRDGKGRGTTVPYHRGRDISPVLVRRIAEDIGMTVEKFLAQQR